MVKKGLFSVRVAIKGLGAGRLVSGLNFNIKGGTLPQIIADLLQPISSNLDPSMIRR